jgi:ribosomal protein S18 acetylase RimI-like enzyme
MTTTTAPCFVPFDPSMADALVPMWRESFEHGVGIVDPHPIEDQRAHLLERVLPEYRVVVALRSEHIVGFVASNDASVSQLYVRVGCHGQGIGSELLRQAKGGSRGSLWLFTFARNAHARRFYEARGFNATAFGFEPMWQLDDVRYEWRAGSSGCNPLVRPHGAAFVPAIDAFVANGSAMVETVQPSACHQP